MNPQAHLFIDDLRTFTQKSIDWCIQESEAASTKIATAIRILLEDTERISKLSNESLSAVNSLKDKVEELVVNKGGDVKNLIHGLKSLCNEHNEIQDMIEPIVEALQFQDRMSQNLQNASQMIGLWLDYREKLAKEAEFSTEHEKEFCDSLYEVTTMKEERDLIKQHFPRSDQPQEGAVDDVAFF